MQRFLKQSIGWSQQGFGGACFLRGFIVMILMTSSLSPAVLRANEPTRVTRDLQALSAEALDLNVPILLMMSASDCPFCMTLREQVLNPMEISGEYVDRVVIREFMIDDLLDATDFSGKKVVPRTFSRGLDVSLTPTLLFLSPDGEEIAKRIVGISNIEFALHYIDKQIETANAVLGNKQPRES